MKTLNEIISQHKSVQGLEHDYLTLLDCAKVANEFAQQQVTLALEKQDKWVSCFDLIEKYNINYGKPKGTLRAREELNFDIEKDGEWVKWQDVQDILKQLKGVPPIAPKQ